MFLGTDMETMIAFFVILLFIVPLIALLMWAIYTAFDEEDAE